MPNVWPIAIGLADLHLSLTQPACRGDKDWLEVQAGYLKQVVDLRNELELNSDRVESVFVLCAGDIFDRWNTPPELINFALQHLPDKMMCVPGQHDLPNHRMDQVHRSGYGVLKEAGKIVDLSQIPFVIKSMSVYGFGWNREIVPPRARRKDAPQIALVHDYCWMEDKKYPGAPEEANIRKFKKQLQDYDVAIFGDNHIHFAAHCGDCTVFNCGGFIRRKSDEIDRVPCVAIIYSDGTVKRKRLDTSVDVFQETKHERKEIPIDMKAFIDGLEKLGEHGLNFVEAVENHLRNEEIDDKTKDIVLAALSAQPS